MQDYGFNAGSKAVGYVTSPQQFDSAWGYQTPQQGVRSTNIFRHTRPENFKDLLSIVVSAVNFVRSQTLNHGLFRVFCNEV